MTAFQYGGKKLYLRCRYRDRQEYLRQRAALMAEQRAIRFDSEMQLNREERRVDRMLIALRDQEIAGYKQAHYFPPAHPFYESRPVIDRSPLLRFLKRMPKGGVLHLHSSSMGSPQDLIRLTYLENCYMYTGTEGLYGRLHFYQPAAVPPGWQPVSALRATIPNFDQQLLSLLTFHGNGTQSEELWRPFEDIFSRIGGLVGYLPAARRYYNMVLDDWEEDNVCHVETRAGLGGLYDLQGNNYGAETQIQLWEEALRRHPRMSLRIIYSPPRTQSAASIMDQLERAIQLRKAHPDLIAGFDLVGEEDTGNPTLYYLDDFLRVPELEQEYGIDLPFYFHTGESDWADNTNLYDAVLLCSRRIGHGYNLFNFPILIPILKATGTPLELCPISNQVLGYVADLRDHPAAGYLNEGVPLTLNSDDPSIFGYSGVTYDFWEAFMAWELDLRSLKQFAFNGLWYSSLSPQEKQRRLRFWESRWRRFIEYCLATF